MNQRERYKEYFRNKAMADHNARGEGVKDFSGPIGKGVGEEAYAASIKEGSIDPQGNARNPAGEPVEPETTEKAPAWKSAAQSAGGEMATQGAQSGSLGQTAGGALMMTGDPYLMAGGLGLTVLAAGEQNKRAQEEKQRQEYNKRIKERQAMMAQIAEMGIK